jgi:hypothetical protein
VPDGDKLWAELEAKAPKPPTKIDPTFLYAQPAYSRPLERQLNELRNGFVLNYNLPVRAEAQDVNEKFRAAVAEGLAEFLSSHDYTLAIDTSVVIRYNIDPAAPTALRLQLAPPEVQLRGKVQDAVAVVGGRVSEAPGSYRPWLAIRGRLQMIDKSGRVAWTSHREIEAADLISATDNPMEVALQKYPETVNIPKHTPTRIDVEAKHPLQVAAARERFLKELAKEVRQSFPRVNGMAPTITFTPSGEVLLLGEEKVTQ